MATLDLVVQNDDAIGNVPEETQILNWAQAAINRAGTALLHHDPYEFTVRVIGLEESQGLNHDYRGKDYPTNVLSFPFEAPADVDVAILGDLAICAPIVANEAQEQGKSLTAHWAHMVIHGTLHLLGFDHIDDDEAEQMEALETELLAGFGFPNPYGDAYSS